MSNWIEEAKRKAKQDKIDLEMKIAAEKTEERRREQYEADRIHSEFMVYAKHEIVAINKVLEMAKRQGLEVSEMEKGNQRFDGYRRDLCYSRIIPGDDGPEYIYTSCTFAWGVRWMISKPEKSKLKVSFDWGFKLSVIKPEYRKLEICLCLKNDNGVILPTVTASEVEQRIKDWLCQIYS